MSDFFCCIFVDGVEPSEGNFLQREIYPSFVCEFFYPEEGCFTYAIRFVENLSTVSLLSKDILAVFFVFFFFFFDCLL